MNCIGRVGSFPDEYVVREVSALRRGFLNLLSARFLSLKHPMEMLERGRAAFVLPVDWERRELYLIRAPRHLRAFACTDKGRTAVERTLRSGVASAPFAVPQDIILTWAVPAGMIEPGEQAAVAACRELQEEAGIEVEPRRLEYVTAVYPSIGGSTECLDLFLAPLAGPVESVAPKGDGTETI